MEMKIYNSTVRGLFFYKQNCVFIFKFDVPKKKIVLELFSCNYTRIRKKNKHTTLIAQETLIRGGF